MYYNSEIEARFSKIFEIKNHLIYCFTVCGQLRAIPCYFSCFLIKIKFKLFIAPLQSKTSNPKRNIITLMASAPPKPIIAICINKQSKQDYHPRYLRIFQKFITWLPSRNHFNYGKHHMAAIQRRYGQ